MNYNAENRTPRDRIGEELFSQVGDMPAQRYGALEAQAAPTFMPVSANRSSCRSECSDTQTPCPICRENQRMNAPVNTGAAQRRSCGSCGAGRGNAGRRPSCGSSRCRTQGEDRLAGLPLAMAYVPMQEWRSLYDLESGFDRGTVFKELDFPFYPTACPRKGCR